MSRTFSDLRVAITGGIGSGKSVICQRLGRRGIRVYDCDAAAKRLMAEDQELQKQLCELVGQEVYVDGRLQKAVLAEFLLQSESHKQAVNRVVHPAVARDFLSSDYQWLESAILFDSGFDKLIHFDVVICVTVDEELRIRRVMERDGISREKTMEWISRQLSQKEMRDRSDFELVSGREDIEEQIDNMLEKIKLQYTLK